MFGDDWTQEFADENNLLYIQNSVFVDAYFGAETNYTWTKFDGSPLNYTNWGRQHPMRSNNVVFNLQPTRRYGENCESLTKIIFCLH